jgi:hypothetical protein
VRGFLGSSDDIAARTIAAWPMQFHWHMATHAIRHHHHSHESGVRIMDFILLALLALALAFLAQSDVRPLLTN